MKRKPSARKSAPKKRVTPKTAAAPPKAPRPKAPHAKTARAKPVTAAAAPSPRRAIFVDVENTSSEENLLRVVQHLQIDRIAQPTELTAVGNWKSVGSKAARTLAGLGAQLVHSAPAVGVRDWSDLWIAVAAGRWLATARPGDQLDLISDDRAFDAVGDAAAAAGVVFRRISYRNIPGVVATAPVAVAEPGPRRRRRRGGRRRSGHPAETLPHSEVAATLPTVVPAPNTPDIEAPAMPSHTDEAAHAASLAHIRTALERLSGGGGRWMNLDALANALKAEGFTRPPGSPRLVTRLRNMKGVEVTPNGMVRLAPETTTAVEAAAADTGSVARRPRRRGGRGGRSRRSTTTAAAEATASPPGETPA